MHSNGSNVTVVSLNAFFNYITASLSYTTEVIQQEQTAGCHAFLGSCYCQD